MELEKGEGEGDGEGWGDGKAVIRGQERFVRDYCLSLPPSAPSAARRAIRTTQERTNPTTRSGNSSCSTVRARGGANRKKKTRGWR